MTGLRLRANITQYLDSSTLLVAILGDLAALLLFQFSVIAFLVDILGIDMNGINPGSIAVSLVVIIFEFGTWISLLALVNTNHLHSALLVIGLLWGVTFTWDFVQIASVHVPTLLLFAFYFALSIGLNVRAFSYVLHAE